MGVHRSVKDVARVVDPDQFDEAEGKPEIFMRMQCFCTYVSVLSGKYPEVVLEMMAYLITITQVSQDFAWVQYDATFRRLAAITGNRCWSQINLSLYSICLQVKHSKQ